VLNLTYFPQIGLCFSADYMLPNILLSHVRRRNVSWVVVLGLMLVVAIHYDTRCLAFSCVYILVSFVCLPELGLYWMPNPTSAPAEIMTFLLCDATQSTVLLRQVICPSIFVRPYSLFADPQHHWSTPRGTVNTPKFLTGIWVGYGKKWLSAYKSSNIYEMGQGRTKVAIEDQ